MAKPQTSVQERAALWFVCCFSAPIILFIAALTLIGIVGWPS
jgi:uncharacterized membrane protein